MNIEDAKMFLRIDGYDEDDLVQGLLDASDIYIANAVGAVDKTNALYELASKLLIAHWYENREVIGKTDNLSFSLESILMQLRYCGDTP